MTKQLAQSRERNDDVFNNTVGKIVVVAIAAEVHSGRTAIEGTAVCQVREGEAPSSLTGDGNAISPHRPFEIFQLQQAEVDRLHAEAAAH